MDEKIKQAMIDGVLLVVRDVTASKFAEVREETMTDAQTDEMLDWLQDYVFDAAKWMLELIERVGKADE